MKQQWALKYTSTQKCAADVKKDYVVTFDGVCAKETEALKPEAASDCEAKVKYSSPGACLVKYLPL